ncbi:PQQ-binding-like beta-propeller repeat protein [Streptomyces sp. NPDC058746]|uniref:outer membrane protein assembly factor BamB family protein n=1 Tax=Streptomyces sp. NPDC058746 TaxID=3346622 RepID=UPI0036C2AEB6
MVTRTSPSNDEEPNSDSSASRRPTRRILIRSGALVALVCVVTAASLFVAGRIPGDSMDVAWETPADVWAIDEGDRERPDAGDGSWLAGDILVQSGHNGATGQDAGTGRKVWEYRSPGTSKICAAEADVEHSVLVVTRDDENRPASAKWELCTTLAGVDMKSGREIWRTPVPAAPREKRPGDDKRARVAAGAGLTVLAHQELRAIDTGTGAPRWTAALPPHCVPAIARPAVRYVGALLACDGTKKEPNGIADDAELHAAAFDPATGALLWSTPIGDREPATWRSGSVRLFSADPLVVGTLEDTYSFNSDGRPNPPLGGTWSNSLSVVDGTMFYTTVLTGGGVGSGRKKSPYRESVLAHDLTTGRMVWRSDLDFDIHALHLRDGRLTVVGEDRALHLYAAPKLYLLDAATGKERDVRRFHYGEVPVGEAFEYKDLLIVGGRAYERS